MESVDWLWNEDTKSFVRSETEKVNEASAHSWFSTLVDMKTDPKTSSGKDHVPDG